MSHFLFVLVLAAGADDDLARTLKAIGTADSYAFTIKDPTGTVDGAHQKGLPAHFVTDRIEFFRQGDVLVYHQGGIWQRTRTGRLSDPLPILGASAKVKAARLPHEELATLSAGMTDVGKDKTGYTAVLPQPVARELARTEDRELAQAGSVRLHVDAKGGLAGYEISIPLKGRRGNADVDGVYTRGVTLKDVGAAKVEVPAAAKAALESH